MIRLIHKVGDVTLTYEGDTPDEVLTLHRALNADASDDWIEWEGGEQPVPDSTFVEYRLRGTPNAIHESAARHLSWTHALARWDIVAYRVVK